MVGACAMESVGVWGMHVRWCMSVSVGKCVQNVSSIYTTAQNDAKIIININC